MYRDAIRGQNCGGTEGDGAMNFEEEREPLSRWELVVVSS